VRDLDEIRGVFRDDVLINGLRVRRRGTNRIAESRGFAVTTIEILERIIGLVAPHILTLG